MHSKISSPNSRCSPKSSPQRPHHLSAKCPPPKIFQMSSEIVLQMPISFPKKGPQCSVQIVPQMIPSKTVPPNCPSKCPLNSLECPHLSPNCLPKCPIHPPISAPDPSSLIILGRSRGWRVWAPRGQGAGRSGARRGGKGPRPPARVPAPAPPPPALPRRRRRTGTAASWHPGRRVAGLPEVTRPEGTRGAGGRGP